MNKLFLIASGSCIENDKCNSWGATRLHSPNGPNPKSIVAI
jgi:hypothetical protein